MISHLDLKGAMTDDEASELADVIDQFIAGKPHLHWNKNKCCIRATDDEIDRVEFTIIRDEGKND